VKLLTDVIRFMQIELYIS